MNIQSNGMGMQSVAMYIMSEVGLLPKFDYSIFADPGAEHPSTYEYLKFLQKNFSIPIIHDTSKNLYNDILTKWDKERVASIPAFTQNGGLIFRQCTSEYKISVVNKNIKRITPNNVNVFIGISYDEIDRVFKPTNKKQSYHYPFCNLIVTNKGAKQANYKIKTRGEIQKWLKDNGYKIPIKSSCVFCPFHNNKAWQEIKKNKNAWDMAVRVDEKIRRKRGLNDDLYLHRSLKPLKSAYLQEDQNELNFDCYGFCDV